MDNGPDDRPCGCVNDNAHAFDTTCNGGELPCADPNQLLTLLSVNRQIYEEAASVFYQENKFLFITVTLMHKFLRGIGLYRRKLVRDIAVVYGIPGHFGKDSKVARATFQLLRDGLPVRSFTLILHEESTIEPKSTRHYPEDVPGIKLLRTLHGFGKLEFCHGP